MHSSGVGGFVPFEPRQSTEHQMTNLGWRNGLRTPEEYRKEAEEYVRLAERLGESGRRTRLLDMAQSCLRLADQAELLSTEGQMNGLASGPATMQWPLAPVQ